jgi:hypothetical protein
MISQNLSGANEREASLAKPFFFCVQRVKIVAQLMV